MCVYVCVCMLIFFVWGQMQLGDLEPCCWNMFRGLFFVLMLSRMCAFSQLELRVLGANVRDSSVWFHSIFVVIFGLLPLSSFDTYLFPVKLLARKV